MTWSQALVHDVARIEIGGTPARAVAKYWSADGEGHPWVSIADLSDPVVVRTSEHISDSGRINSNVKLVPAGTTMMSFKLTLGRVAVAGRDLYTNEAIAAFHPTSERLHPGWLKYALPVAVGNVIADTAVKGATLNKKSLRTLTIPLPPRPEQRAIIHVLTTLDDLIAETEAANAKLEAIRQGLLHDLLTRGLDENGDVRAQPSSGRMPVLPDGWWSGELRDLLAEAPRNGIYMPPSAIGTGTLMVGQTSFDATNRVDFRIGRRAQVPTTEQRLFGLLDTDILLVRVFATPEGVGRPVFVESPPEPSVFESNMMRIRVQTGRVDPYYLWLWMGLPQSRRHFTYRANASTQASINRSVVDCLPCWIPSPPEQARILKVVREHDGQLNVTKDLLSKLSELRSGLRHELLTGRTPVTPELIGLPSEDGDV